VSWTEWKNTFSLEIYCRTAKLDVSGLAGSYGPQRLTLYRMKPELGPPDVETFDYPAEETSWQSEWAHFADSLRRGGALLGDLESLRYCWEVVEAAYAQTTYGTLLPSDVR
jgi:hypothetical protein